MLGETWFVLSGPDIVTRVVATFGAIAFAIVGYFPLHHDLRTRDGLVPTPREHWARIFGLLAYFVLGAVVCGGVCFVAFQVLGVV